VQDRGGGTLSLARGGVWWGGYPLSGFGVGGGGAPSCGWDGVPSPPSGIWMGGLGLKKNGIVNVGIWHSLIIKKKIFGLMRN